eukprot:1400480-Prymnesium_polylepis.1
MRLPGLEAVRILCGERGGEHAMRQACEAHVLVDAHGVLIVSEGAKPQHRHEVALVRRERKGERQAMLTTVI